MIRSLFAMSALVAAVVTLGAPASAQNTPPKDVLRESHGDWEVRCLEGTETCAMSQVGKTEDGKRALLVTIQRVTGPTTQDGKQISVTITAITDDTVTMDANHPLAGKDLVFEVELVEIV